MSATITTRPITTRPVTTRPIMTRPVTTRPVTTRPIMARPVTCRRSSAPEPTRSVGSATPRRIPAVGHDVPAATYRRRRAVVGTVLAVLVAAGVVLTHDVLAGSGGDPASAAVSQPARTRTTVTARPGDTLWSIAERHHPQYVGRHDATVSLSRYVDALVDLNGGPAIQAGQAVILP